MVLKLKSLLEEQPLALVLKAALFGVFLVFVRVGDFGIIPILLFLIVAIILYTSSNSDGPAYFISFLGLVFLSLIISAELGEAVPLAVSFLISACLFYILLGLKSLFFIYRARWYYLLQLTLLYFISLIFFLSDKLNNFFLESLGVFVIIFILLWEFFLLINSNYEDSKLSKITPGILAGVSSLLIIESFWVISLLPLSFLNSTNLGLLVIFVLIDLFNRYNQGNLTYRNVLIDITIFIAITILIFTTSAWNI